MDCLLYVLPSGWMKLTDPPLSGVTDIRSRPAHVFLSYSFAICSLSWKWRRRSVCKCERSSCAGGWGSWNSLRVPWEGNMTEMSRFVPLAKEKLHPEREGGWLVGWFIGCSRRKIMLSISESLFVSSGVWKTKDRRGDSSPHFSWEAGTNSRLQHSFRLFPVLFSKRL